MYYKDKSGLIFIYDDNSSMLHAYKEMFNSYGFETFGTDNVYQLLQYSKELSPDVMIFNVNNDLSPAVTTVNHFGNEINLDKYPLLVLKPQNIPFNVYQGISHYIHTPLKINKFLDIIESYCLGKRDHNILLIDNYHEEKSYFHQQLEDEYLSYFEVHDERAANLYLRKNMPKVVCIEYTEKFFKVRHQLMHEKIFYVDREQDITEIKKFLN